MAVDCASFYVNFRAEMGWTKNSNFGRFIATAVSFGSLCVISSVMIGLSVYRLEVGSFTPSDVDQTVMLIFGVLGLIVDITNFAAFYYLSKTEDSLQALNMRSAYFHVLADTLRSCATVGLAVFLLFDDNANEEAIDSITAIAASGLVLLGAIPSLFEMTASYSEFTLLKEDTTLTPQYDTFDAGKKLPVARDQTSENQTSRDGYDGSDTGSSGEDSLEHESYASFSESMQF